MGKPNEEKAAVAEPEAMTEAPPVVERGAKSEERAAPRAGKPPAAQAYGGDAEIRPIDVDKLKYSPTNPRKHFDQASLLELAKSFSSVGVIAPPVVRPWKGKAGKYEVVVGERRVRAAKLGGVKSLLCVVREMADEAVLRVQIVENLQREDVNPIEEAEGYQTLVQKGGYVKRLPVDSKEPGRRSLDGIALHPVTGEKLPDVDRIAQEIGKSARYVYDRLQLARRLIKPVIEAALQGHLSASHAVELARLEPPEQERAFAACFNMEGADAAEVLKELNSKELFDDNESVMSLRSLKGWIADHVHRALADAAFDNADAKLLPAAGPCALCHKRSDYELGSTELGKKSQCLDPKCFDAKKAAHIKALQADAKEAGEKLLMVEKDRYSSHGYQGSAGKAQKVEAKTPGAVKAVDKASGEIVYVKPERKTNSGAGSDEKDAAAQRVAAEKVEAKEKEDKAYRAELALQLGRAVHRAGKMQEQDLRDIAGYFLDNENFSVDFTALLAEAMNWPKAPGGDGYDAGRKWLRARIAAAKPLDLMLFMLLATHSETFDGWGAAVGFKDLLKRHEIDVEACREKAKAQIAGVAAKKPEEKAAPAPKNMKEWAAKQTGKGRIKAKHPKTAKKGKKK